MEAMPSNRFMVLMEDRNPARTWGVVSAKSVRVRSMCARAGSEPKAPRTKRWPAADRSAADTADEAMKLAANHSAPRVPDPRSAAAVATSTMARVRAARTSGWWAANPMMVMPPMEWPASTASWTSRAARTAAKSSASVWMVNGAVPRPLAPWPRWS